MVVIAKKRMSFLSSLMFLLSPLKCLLGSLEYMFSTKDTIFIGINKFLKEEMRESNERMKKSAYLRTALLKTSLQYEKYIGYRVYRSDWF